MSICWSLHTHSPRSERTLLGIPYLFTASTKASSTVIGWLLVLHLRKVTNLEKPSMPPCVTKPHLKILNEGWNELLLRISNGKIHTIFVRAVMLMALIVIFPLLNQNCHFVGSYFILIWYLTVLAYDGHLCAIYSLALLHYIFAEWSTGDRVSFLQSLEDRPGDALIWLVFVSDDILWILYIQGASFLWLIIIIIMAVSHWRQWPVC